MQEKISILLIEDDVDTCNEFQHDFASREALSLVGITNNSTEAIELVQTYLPDVILLDLELHHGGGNGLLFLAELSHIPLRHQPYIIITTNNTSTVTLESTRELGADFILAKYEKFYSIDYVARFILLMEKAIRQKNSLPRTVSVPSSPAQLEQRQIQRISRELDLVGISPRAVGYQYLIDAILITIKDSRNPRVAHDLAKKYKKSEASIERGMQNAINRTWQTNSIEDLQLYYTARIRSDRGVPTLMEFIHYYATKIKNDIE